MKKYLLLILCITALFAWTAGCADTARQAVSDNLPDSSLDTALIGTWTENYFGSSFIFNSDGTGEDTFWDLPFSYQTAEDGTLLLTFTDEMWGSTQYSYRIDGNILTLQQEDSSESYQYTKQEN